MAPSTKDAPASLSFRRGDLRTVKTPVLCCVPGRFRNCPENCLNRLIQLGLSHHPTNLRMSPRLTTRRHQTIFRPSRHLLHPVGSSRHTTTRRHRNVRLTNHHS